MDRTKRSETYNRCAHCLYCGGGASIACKLALVPCANVQMGQCLVCDTDWDGEDLGEVARWRMSLSCDCPDTPEYPNLMDYKQLTALLVIHHTNLTNWVRKGMPVVSTNKGRRYDAGEAKDWILNNVKNSRILANAARL